jgi:uncharacterized protein with gpF-like domain
MIARTESTRVAAEGALLNYKQNDIEECSWLAGTGERTCSDCWDMNGKIMSISEAQGQIPKHPYCRCTYIPIVKSSVNQNVMVINKVQNTVQEGWVTGNDGRHYYVDDEGNSHSGKDAMDASHKDKVSQIAKDAASSVGEVDKGGNSLGNCKEISNQTAKKIKDSGYDKAVEVVDVRVYKDESIGHAAVRLPDDKLVVDTQTWQYTGKPRGNIKDRKVVFTETEYKKIGFAFEDNRRAGDD